MNTINNLNIFTHYKQDENHYTNGLISILSLSNYEESPFLNVFFKDIFSTDISNSKLNFKVLKDIKGTADAEISNDEIFILIETKIKSGTLQEEQIRSHLEILNERKEKDVKLILLTPDDSKSKYIENFTNINNSKIIIIHVEWKKVYDYLNAATSTSPLFREIVTQYLSLMHDTIFEQDIVALIVKISFGDESKVYEDKYIDEMRRGEWTDWGTPRNYKNLDGLGRKLILYDKTRQGLTIEVEIKKIKEEHGDYPYRNVFVPGSIRILDPPIPLEKIRKIKGFENFGIHRKDRNPYRNLTHEQYKELI